MIDIAILAIIAAPALILLILRSNAAVVLLTLFAGYVLSQFAADDTSRVLGTVLQSAQAAEFKIIPLALLLTPAILAALFLAKTSKASHFLLQIVPAAAVGAVGLLLAQPYLSASTTNQLQQSQVWNTMTSLMVAVIGGSIFVALVSLWLQRPKAAGKHDEHGGHH